MRYYLSLAAVFVVGLSILAACSKAPAGNNATANAPSNAPSNTAAPKDPADSAPRISLDDAKQAFKEGNVIFVDTRAEIQYKQEHIKGAINVPAEAMELRYKEIPTGKKIIAYCS